MTSRRIRWQMVFGMGFLLLFTVLLFIRLGLHESLSRRDIDPYEVKTPPPSPGKTWMSLQQYGQKIGHAERQLIRSGKGYHYSEQILMHLNTLGMIQPVKVRTSADLNKDSSLSAFDFSLNSNLFSFQAQGEVTKDQLTIRVGERGRQKPRVIPLRGPLFLTGAIGEIFSQGALRSGQVQEIDIFDPVTMGKRKARIGYLGEEKIEVMGRLQAVQKWMIDWLGIKQFAWSDNEGRIVKEEGPLGLSIVQVTREEALEGGGGRAVADLTEVAAIRPTRPIKDSASLTLLRIRLGIPEEGTFDLNGGRQHYRQGILTIRRESWSALPSPPQTLSDHPTALQATPWIESDHVRIRTQAAEIVQPNDSDGRKAERLLNWVHQNLEKRPVLSIPSALTTLTNRQGDCNEHAVLLAALARASGIPAEVEAGLVYLRGRFFYHAWNALYLKDRGGWVTADAVLGQMPTDVTHIRLVRGEGDRHVDLAALIGRLTLEIVESQR